MKLVIDLRLARGCGWRRHTPQEVEPPWLDFVQPLGFAGTRRSSYWYYGLRYALVLNSLLLVASGARSTRAGRYTTALPSLRLGGLARDATHWSEVEAAGRRPAKRPLEEETAVEGASGEQRRSRLAGFGAFLLDTARSLRRGGGWGR